ncbi:unnamed protein product [Pedinophyceae sp. YPF-701]|nr:unnamed protein product [Pedinophyceae sp. YPF-701]
MKDGQTPPGYEYTPPPAEAAAELAEQGLPIQPVPHGYRFTPAANGAPKRPSATRLQMIMDFIYHRHFVASFILVMVFGAIYSLAAVIAGTVILAGAKGVDSEGYLDARCALGVSSQVSTYVTSGGDTWYCCDVPVTVTPLDSSVAPFDTFSNKRECDPGGPQDGRDPCAVHRQPIDVDLCHYHPDKPATDFSCEATHRNKQNREYPSCNVLWGGNWDLLASRRKLKEQRAAGIGLLCSLAFTVPATILFFVLLFLHGHVKCLTMPDNLY